MLLGYLKASDPALADTFLCNSSMAAVASARRDLIDGRPSRRTAAAAASTSAAVATASETETVCDLALVMACVVCVLNWRTKLSMVVKEVTKDPFSDPALFQKKIAAFQRSKSLATSRVLDAPTTTAMDAALAHLSAGTTRVAKLLRARLDDIDPVPTLDNFMRLAGQAERTRALWHGSAKNRIDRLLMDSADLGTSSKVEGLLQGGREFATSFFKGGGSGSGAHGGGPGSSTPGGGGGEFTGTGLGGATSATVGLGGAGSSGDFGSRYQPFGDTLAIGDASSGIPSGSGSRFGRRRPRERKTSGGGGGHKKKNSSGSGKLGIPRILQPPPVGTTSRPRSRSGSSGGGEEESDPEEERRTTTATGRAGVLELASSILGRRGSDHSRTMAAAASAGASSAGGADSMPAADTLIPLPISNPFSRRHVKKARRAARETVSAVTESAGAAVHAVTGTASHLLQSASIGLARGPSAAPAAAGLAAIRPMSPNSRNAMFPSPVASSMVLGSPTSLSAMTGAPGSWYPANTSIMASFHPSVSMYLPSLAPSHGADRAVLPAPQELPPEYAMRVFRSRVQRDARTRRAVSLTRPPPDDQVALADAVYVRRRTRSTGSAPSLEGAAMAGRHAWTREAWAPQRPVDAVGRDVSVVREQMAALLHSNHFIHVGLNELEAIALQLERDHYQLQQVYHAKQLDVEVCIPCFHSFTMADRTSFIGASATSRARPQ
ncbi:hypothetical protein BC828DRAFT_113284 [Blastocladiella britannica]|nr:hypothetical protein BC828DRAFT_113284 [Blastocladiella britannica]